MSFKSILLEKDGPVYTLTINRPERMNAISIQTVPELMQALSQFGSYGNARAAFDQSLKHAKERVAFGQPIGQFQGIQWQFADMALELDAAKLLMWQAAWLAHQGPPQIKEASMAKLYATEMCATIADQSGSFLLAYGVMLALWHRQRTGRGRQVDVSLLGGRISLQGWCITSYYLTGRTPQAGSRSERSPLFNFYRAADGWFALTIIDERQWASLCRLIDRPELAQEPRFQDREERVILRGRKTRRALSWYTAMAWRLVLAATHAAPAGSRPLRP